MDSERRSGGSEGAAEGGDPGAPIITGPDDVKRYFGLGPGDSWAALQKAVFKGTDCGAFIEQLEPEDGVGIAVGSIVEGSDAQTETYKLKYPFTEKVLGDALDAVELEAAELWEEANGEDLPDDHPGFDPAFLTY